MNAIQAAIYARVSSERQAETRTIASQLAALRARVAQDGLALPEEFQFIDDGYSGATPGPAGPGARTGSGSRRGARSAVCALP